MCGGNIMEYLSKNDFFLEFRPIFNEKKEFVEYILINVSDNFKIATHFNPKYVLGKGLYQLVSENGVNAIITEDLHYHMLPNTGRKFKEFINYLNRWYLINIFSDEKNYLLLFYTDITKFKLQIDGLQQANQTV